jgi:hypothetical protein
VDALANNLIRRIGNITNGAPASWRGAPKIPEELNCSPWDAARFPFFSVHFLIHYGEYDILPFGSSSKRRTTSERKQKT